MLSVMQALRVSQIQVTARALIALARSRAGATTLAALRRIGPLCSLLHALIGYRRPFGSFAEADAAVRAVANGGHEHPTLAKLHLDINQSARPSDYPAMFHLYDVLPSISRIYDLGGSVGNLYYCYRRYMRFPQNLVWQVNDLPIRLQAASDIAEQRQAWQLTFSSHWEDASGADLLIASGSIHYFPTPLPEMISRLKHFPRYVLVNRTPLTDYPTVATTQDGLIRIACVVYNRADLIRGLENIGYEVVDQWKAPEVSLHIPGYPEISVDAYSGIFLRLTGRDRTPTTA